MDELEKVKHRSNDNWSVAKRFCDKFDRYVTIKADPLGIILYDKKTKKEFKTNSSSLLKYID